MKDRIIQRPAKVNGRVPFSPFCGVSSFNFLDAVVRYVAIPSGAAGGGYVIYKVVSDDK